MYSNFDFTSSVKFPYIIDSIKIFCVNNADIKACISSNEKSLIVFNSCCFVQPLKKKLTLSCYF